ncbi:dihydropteroate synthase [Egibacter rhizosphaerae]|uniref:dihydropteroate synthase n=2 Tax=Egibacter rhizosphaerae TaxID=1670831 RepID=A0A411YL55_9ACTN|nr:dihydropteroate synthase [Egibacter rhizosphaerae]
MGIVNVTPDSFFDGGVVYPGNHPDAAVRLARRLAAEGAAIIDVGGESTRPGADPVDEAEELARVVPVIEALAAANAPEPKPVVSIDTMKPEVARQAVAAGAQLVNDVSGGPPELLEVVARTGVGYVFMHRRGTPKDMQQHVDYGDVVGDVFDALTDGLRRCVAAGIPESRIAVDPGIGFAKTVAQNCALLRAVPELRSLGRPVVVGASRKSFLGKLLDGESTADRLEGSLACAALATADRAGVLRVHDVAETARAVRVARAIAAADDAVVRA